MNDPFWNPFLGWGQKGLFKDCLGTLNEKITTFIKSVTDANSIVLSLDEEKKTSRDALQKAPVIKAHRPKKRQVNKIPSAERDTLVLVWTYFEGSSQGSEVEIPKGSLDSLKAILKPNQVIGK